MVCEQTCSCGLKIDKSLWRTFGAFDLVRSSHMWIQANCYVGNTTQQCRLGLFQDSDFCTGSWGFKVNIRGDSVHFGKSNICANKLDVHKTDHQQKPSSYLLIQVYACLGSRLSIFGIWPQKSFIPHQTKPTKPNMWKRHGRNPSANTQPNMQNKFQPRTPSRSNKHWSRSIKRNTFWSQC